MFVLRKRRAIEYLEAEELAALGFLTHAFCTRRGGVSRPPYDGLNTGDLVGDRPEDRLRNLDRIRREFAIPPRGMVLMNQLHGDRIEPIGDEGMPPARLPDCDGLITDRPGVALGIRTADCVPILFADRTGRAIGAAHAGWRGTALGIAPRIVAALVERYSCRREDILAAIGPAIGPCCYQVDGPVLSAFPTQPDVALFSRPCPQPDRRMVDLAEANRLQLLAAGVPDENVRVAAFCTACAGDLFFSHRAAAGRTGRQLSLIMLRTGEARKNA